MTDKEISSIFQQIKLTTIEATDEECNYVVITFTKPDLKFIFEYDYAYIYITHKSQAVIAAMATASGQQIKYKTSSIESHNTVFKWLDIDYSIEHISKVRATTSAHMTGEGIISFF